MSLFEGIEEFVAVADAGGFSSAARNLGLSTSHVSRRLSALEERLGTPLVARSTRHVRLTEMGEIYLKHCKELLGTLDEANQSVRSGDKVLRGKIKVSAAGEFADLYLAPALMKFGQQHPGLQLHLDFNARFVNMVEEGIDFAIRYGKLTGSELTAKKLIERQMVAAASPVYIKERGAPKHPHELKDHDCVVSNSDEWRFEDDGTVYSVRIKGRWRSNSGRSLVAACRVGYGIAYLPRSSYGGALDDGSLVPVLENYSANNTSWIVYPKQKHLTARASAAIAFLVDNFSDWGEKESV